MTPYINSPNLSPAAWNPKLAQEGAAWNSNQALEGDSGEFSSYNWPPKTYTCNFCRKEFRSAQALGGHMNVHRRDRAKLNQTSHESVNPAASSSANSSTLIIPHCGLCLLCQLPHASGIFAPTTMSACFSLEPPITNSAIGFSTKAENVVFMNNISNENDCKEESVIEELDLELRLGRGPAES